MKSQLPSWVRELRRCLPAGEVDFSDAALTAHSGDKWFASAAPQAVVLPRSTDSVVRLAKFSAKYGVPLTARGAGFGYVGGCVPVRGGVAVSFAAMNRIKEISPGDFVAVVEPGVITATLQNKVERRGLFYPPDPASRADCTIGGNIATNAGGPRCLKYGVTRDYVLGVEVVLADGTVARLGSRTHKNKTGFDLTRLFVGSEGMLGLVTEATLKLLPLPPSRALLMAGFDSERHAALAIQKIFKAGFLPCALEIADAFTLAAARKRTGSDKLSGCRSLIFVEVDGQELSVRHEVELLSQLLKTTKPRFIDQAIGSKACESLWQLRREFSFALRDTGLMKLNEDVVVPRSKLEELFAFAAQLQKRFQLQVACFGHAGDGNIHVNLMIDASDARQKQRSEAALDALFRQVIAWGGVITGEHGIGLAKKPWWPLAAKGGVETLHQRIKQALDPKGLLNPGKFLD